MHHQALSALTALLAALPAAQAGLYTKSSPVLQLDSRSYDKLIAKSNHTSIVEFYAPWCGHCQNLKPAFEKAAKNLDGLAKVAAIDCDEDANKAFCGSMGVQGFPTLKIVRPGKKPGKPIVEDYQGARTATGITEAVVSKITNHVKRVTDKDLDAFLEREGPKAILFTEKGTTSALLRSIGIDFLDVISVAQVRNKEKKAVEKFGIEKFPAFVLVSGEGEDAVVYEGELNKKDMVEFLKQAGQPNPDPAPSSKGKKDKATKDKAKPDKKKTAKSDDKAAPEPEESPETTTAESTAEESAPTPNTIPITRVTDSTQFAERCLQAKSTTCVLALIPAEASEVGDKAVASLSQLNTKYIHGNRHTFPFLALPADISGTSTVRAALKLESDVELVAINVRRGWWKQYEGDFSAVSVESWIDAIRMGEGPKQKLPKDIIVEVAEDSTEAEPEREATAATDPEPEMETEAPESNDDDHDEL